MVVHSRPALSRTMASFGANIRTWRRAQRLTAAIVADRAGITRDTLRAIENGSGTVKLENVFAVLTVLGLDEGVITATDPAESDRGRALLEQGLPERVRL